MPHAGSIRGRIDDGIDTFLFYARQLQRDLLPHGSTAIDPLHDDRLISSCAVIRSPLIAAAAVRVCTSR